MKTDDDAIDDERVCREMGLSRNRVFDLGYGSWMQEVRLKAGALCYRQVWDGTPDFARDEDAAERAANAIAKRYGVKCQTTGYWTVQIGRNDKYDYLCSHEYHERPHAARLRALLRWIDARKRDDGGDP